MSNHIPHLNPRNSVFRTVFFSIAALTMALVMIFSVGKISTVSATSINEKKPNTVNWHTDSAWFYGDNFHIKLGDTYFYGIPDSKGFDVHSYAGSDRQTLEVQWTENNVPMRLYVYFERKGNEWYVYDLTTYDGSKEGEPISYEVKSDPVGAEVEKNYYAKERTFYTLAASKVKGEIYCTACTIQGFIGASKPMHSVSWVQEGASIKSDNMYIQIRNDADPRYNATYYIPEDAKMKYNEEKDEATFEARWTADGVKSGMQFDFVKKGSTSWQLKKLVFMPGNQKKEEIEMDLSGEPVIPDSNGVYFRKNQVWRNIKEGYPEGEVDITCENCEIDAFTLTQKDGESSDSKELSNVKNEVSQIKKDVTEQRKKLNAVEQAIEYLKSILDKLLKR